MRGKKLQTIVCVDCGKTVTAFTRKRQRCPECALVRNAAKQKEREKTYEAKPKPVEPKPIKIYPKTSIGEVLIATERYNKENKKHLSYGQFVALMEKGV